MSPSEKRRLDMIATLEKCDEATLNRIWNEGWSLTSTFDPATCGMRELTDDELVKEIDHVSVHQALAVLILTALGAIIGGLVAGPAGAVVFGMCACIVVTKRLSPR